MTSCPQSLHLGPSTLNLWVCLARFSCKCFPPLHRLTLLSLLADLHTLCHGPTKAYHPCQGSVDSTRVTGAAGEHVQHDVSSHWSPEEEVQNDRWGDSGETQYVYTIFRWTTEIKIHPVHTHIIPQSLKEFVAFLHWKVKCSLHCIHVEVKGRASEKSMNFILIFMEALTNYPKCTTWASFIVKTHTLTKAVVRTWPQCPQC